MGASGWRNRTGLVGEYADTRTRFSHAVMVCQVGALLGLSGILFTMVVFSIEFVLLCLLLDVVHAR